MNPLLERALGRKRENVGRASERKTAKRNRARQTPASGALPGAKGDMKLNAPIDFLIEAKATEAATARVELEHLLKIRREALAAGRAPALTLTYVDRQGKPRQGGAFVILDELTFQELLERAKR